MADPDRVAMARQMLAHLGVTLADLQEDLALRPDVPTVGEYLPQVLAAAGPGARKTYGTYWLRMAAAYGSRALNQVAASDIEALQRDIVASALSRRNSRHGRHAGEHVIAAARAFYNPGHRRRAHRQNGQPGSPGGQTTAPALDPPRLVATRTRRNQPRRKDRRQRRHPRRATAAPAHRNRLPVRWRPRSSIVRFGHQRGLVRLTEKGGTLRWQPVTLNLATALADHARCRGAVLPGDALLRYRNGTVLTRRYDHLWWRLGIALPWAAAQGISTHWLHHTTLTWVGTAFRLRGGPRLRRAHRRQRPATTTHIKADLQAVATALSAMTGHPHPLALPSANRGA